MAETLSGSMSLPLEMTDEGRRKQGEHRLENGLVGDTR